MLKSPCLLAFFVASLVFNIALILSHVEWEQQKGPPRENGSYQTNNQQTKSEAGTPAASVQIECDPDCSAQSADDRGDKPWWNWPEEYIQKMRHDPVAGFTGLLFVATIILACLAGRQITHSRLVERAYILGGGPYNVERQAFQLDVGNYGKTPGELLRVQIGFCERMSVPPNPTYLAAFAFRDYLPPGLRQRVIAYIAIPAGMTDPVIFGRYHFRDIFDKRRSTGFILHIDRNTGSTLPIEAPEAYVAETEDDGPA